MWNDWDQIDAAQREVDRLLEEARNPKPQPPAPAPVEPRMVHPPLRQVIPTEYGEPRWFEGGRFGRRVTVNGVRREFVELEPPVIDRERGNYLTAKYLRAAGDAGLRFLRDSIRKVSNGDD